MNDIPFRLVYVGKEEHLMMPHLTALTTVQNLYDILFQYVVTPEKEEKLVKFINMIHEHLNDGFRGNIPFSVPVEELEFLGEGLAELKLLCWQKIPVYVFAVEMDQEEDPDRRDSSLEAVENVLADLFVYKWRGESQIIVYPSSIL